MREGESCGVNNRSGHKKTNNTDETDKFVRETDITEMGGVIHASIFRTDFYCTSEDWDSYLSLFCVG